MGDENKVIDHTQHMIVSKLKHKILPNCLQVRSFRASLGELKIRNMACLGLRGLNKLTCGSFPRSKIGVLRGKSESRVFLKIRNCELFLSVRSLGKNSLKHKFCCGTFMYYRSNY